MPAMVSEFSKSEQSVLSEILSKTKRYLEFGIGGSTMMAIDSESIGHIDTVESSPEFVEKFRQSSPDLISDQVKKNRLNIHVVDIGPTKEWGYPVNDLSKDLWCNYYGIINNLSGSWDTVLIDGRFRVATTARVLMSVSEETLVLIHDFWNRHWYHELVGYLDEESRVGTLGVFRKKQSCNEVNLNLLLDKHMWNTG